MLQFRRSMSPQEVRNTIIRGFSKAHGLDNWTYLACDSDNHLFISKNQELDGNDVINRKGCLYICPKVMSYFLYWIINIYVKSSTLESCSIQDSGKGYVCLGILPYFEWLVVSTCRQIFRLLMTSRDVIHLSLSPTTRGLIHLLSLVAVLIVLMMSYLQ